MPRPLVFGNGSLLINLDDRYRIRDLFYPHVGLYNHLSGHSIRMGVWIDGDFSWLDEDAWHRQLAYRPDSLVGDSVLNHPQLGLRIEIFDAVDPVEDCFTRRLTLHNLRDESRDLRLFFSHDLRLNESDIGDTAFFYPFAGALIHYKGDVTLLFAATTASGGIDQYATGIKGFGGLEGTWRDAEDGELSMNPIAQGSVDSTFGIKLSLPPQAEAMVVYRIVCAHSIDAAAQLYRTAQANPAFYEGVEKAGHDYLAGLKLELEGLPPGVQALCRKSLLLMLTQIDREGGIVAATDSDIMATNRANYCYVWPRDGAFISSVFARAGDPEIGQRFFRFCEPLLTRDRPFFLQKYRPDGTFGASWHPWIYEGQAEIPFQEDETALTLLSMWECYEAGQDIGALRDLWPHVKLMADFIAGFRDSKTGLPLPSYDLWEERRGIHTFTTATVVASLTAASQIAAELGEAGEGYRMAAEETRAALRTHLFDESRGVFYRRLIPRHGRLEPDTNIDSSSLHVGLLGVLPMDDPQVQANLNTIVEKLWVASNVGGLARYEGDYYFRKTEEVPGNPWIITTLWLSQSEIASAKNLSDLDSPLVKLEWALHLSAPAGILPEQVHPLTGEHLSVSPLTWSHAEFVKTCLDWTAKHRALKG